MIKVTIETDETTGSASIKDGVTIDDVLECVDNAIKACGYHPIGELFYAESGS